LEPLSGVLKVLILRPWLYCGCDRCWFEERQKVHTCLFQLLAQFDETREDRKQGEEKKIPSETLSWKKENANYNRVR
jgi:hypothetical protein